MISLKSKLTFLTLTLLAFPALANPTPPVIANLRRVNPSLYRGGRLGSEEAVQLISKLGVKTVINLQGGDLTHEAIAPIVAKLEPGETPEAINLESKRVQAAGMNYFNFPIDSVGHVTFVENHDINQILKILEDPAAQPVYVHCEHGRDRTGLIIALYRVKHDHWTIKDAHKEWERLGHGDLRQLGTGFLDLYFEFKSIAIKTENL